MNTKALFYPTIEIEDENWLKSSLLFWDEIRTIVPESIHSPYNNRTTAILSEREVIKPEIVNSDHHIVRELSENVSEFLNTEEGFQLLYPSSHVSRLHNNKISRIHFEKLGERMIDSLPFHPDRMYSTLFRKLAYARRDNDGFLLLNSAFVSYYMTLLANKICEESGLQLLTDNPLCSNLSSKVKLGFKGFSMEDKYYRAEKINQQLAQGIFMNLVIQRIDFHPSTNVIDILSFKNDHKDTLGLFRTNVKKLLKDIPTNVSYKALVEEIESIYNDDFLPSFNNLKKELDESDIKWTCDNFAKIGFYSVSSTSIPLYLLGLTVPQALLAGAGVSVIASLVSYNLDKKKKLRENPYNYLLEIERTL